MKDLVNAVLLYPQAPLGSLYVPRSCEGIETTLMLSDRNAVWLKEGPIKYRSWDVADLLSVPLQHLIPLDQLSSLCYKAHGMLIHWLALDYPSCPHVYTGYGVLAAEWTKISEKPPETKQTWNPSDSSFPSASWKKKKKNLQSWEMKGQMQKTVNTRTH